MCKAQVLGDNTLSPRTQVSTDIPGGINFTISGGVRAENNLFHSFEEFSIPQGGSANFVDISGVENIISRVTGGTSSSINGEIQIDNAADLFLINPNGIIFGQNATLAINGSFIASTANNIQFNNEELFGLDDLQAQPQLLVSVPIGLQFGNRVQPITNQAQSFGFFNGLNKTIAFVSGGITFEQGSLFSVSTSATGFDPAGRLELSSVDANSTVTLLHTDKGWQLEHDMDQDYQNILLDQSSFLRAENVWLNGREITINDTSRIQGLDVNIIASDLMELTDESFIDTLTFQGNITVETRDLIVDEKAQISANALFESPGNITLTVPGSITLAGTSFIDMITGDTDSVGEIKINTGNLTILEGSQISTLARIGGDAGNVIINATESVTLDGQAPGFNSGLITRTEGVANAGEILEITTGQLIVRNGARISAETSGAGNGGTVKVNADLVELSGNSTAGESSGLFTLAEEGSSGNAGDIEIATNQLIVQDGAQISAETRSSGDGGQITVDADLVQLSRTSTSGEPSGLFTRTMGSGNAGEILEIATDQLIVQDGARISAETLGAGDGGEVRVNADLVELSGTSASGKPSGLFTSSEGEGNAGELNITANQLIVRDGAQISAETLGAGDGGRIIVNADLLELSGISSTTGESSIPSGLFTLTTDSGDAGDVEVTINQLLVQDGARISADSGSEMETEDRILQETAGDIFWGEAGNIILTVVDELTLTGNGSGLFASTTQGSVGQTAGSIVISNPKVVIMRDGAEISVNSEGDVQGGDIYIQTDLLLLREGSLISTSAGNDMMGGGGDGGNITINNENGFIVAIPSENSDIQANAFDGNGGNINITALSLLGIEPRDSNDPTLSDITASSELGINGEIIINELEIDPEQGLVELSEDIVVPRLARGCAAGAATTADAAESINENAFHTGGQGGLPQSPEDMITSALTLDEVDTQILSETIPLDTNSPVESLDLPKPLIEAQGVNWLPDGTVELTATPRNVTPYASWQSPLNCPEN